MADITAFPAIQDVLVSGDDVREFTATEAITAGMVVGPAATGVSNAVVPMDALEELKTVKSNVNIEDIFRSSRIMESVIKKKNQWREINYLKRLTKVDGIWNKAHILFGYVFPCKEFMMHRYQIRNKKLIGVYYVFRFGTALYWGINALWQLLLYPFKSK